MLRQFTGKSDVSAFASTPASVAPDVIRLHAGLQCVRVTAAFPDDPHRVLWRQPVDQFARQSAGSAVARLRQVIADVQSEPAPTLLALSIPPSTPTGFAVDLGFTGKTVNALFGTLFWTFDEAAGAWTWVERALSTRYRLRTIAVGGREREWHLESTGEEAGDALATGNLGLLDRWRAKTSEVRQNALQP